MTYIEMELTLIFTIILSLVAANIIYKILSFILKCVVYSGLLYMTFHFYRYLY